MTLYILKYNNYYNRLVKQENNMADYLPYILYTLYSTNFNPGDGVNTTHIIGAGDYDGYGDYLIAYDNNEIVSRWFIIDADRTRAGQYQLTLRRDLIVDYYNVITLSPMFIEKATVRDDDPAIYNTEGVSVNLIKTNEYVLKDDSQCAWLVGYFNREYAGGDQIEITYSNPTVDRVLAEGQTIQQFISNYGSAYRLSSKQLSFKSYIGFPSYGRTAPPYLFKMGTSDALTLNAWSVELLPPSTTVETDFTWAHVNNYNQRDAKAESLKDALNKNTNLFALASLLNSYINTGNSYNPTTFNEIIKLSGSIIQSYDGKKKYKLYANKLVKNYSTDITSDLGAIDGVSAIPTYLNQKMRSIQNYNSYTPDFKFEWVEEYVNLTYEEVSFETFTFTFPSEANRVHLNDAPYDMFCIPYKDSGLKINLYNTTLGEDNKFTSMGSISALTAAQSLAEKLSTNLYDLQLLPFCPLLGWSINPDGEFEKTIVAKSDTYVTKEVVYSSQAQFVMFFSTSSQGSYNSSQLHLINTETNEELSLPIPMENKKISNECDMYRLCSPNYNGLFQFSASKLNGITGFNVDYTYLPYSPYIHVNPNFQGLYGKDFDDARGLICQGDFSISYLSDAWENYQVQNKNYANIFNRGTENLELNHKIQREQQIFNAITGTIIGGAAGASTGAKAGPLGAIAGTVIGTATSAIGGVLDVSRGDILRNEALDYRQDLFNYQLDNIQALPDSIAKVTAHTINNKIFPILEYYTCTDIEKLAIANKIAYNGMTVGRIGTMSEFLINDWSYNGIKSKGYIKGQLIRYMDDGEDFHLVNSISGELYKGVYTK